MKKIMDASPKESVTSRLPRANGGTPAAPAAPKAAPAAKPVASTPTESRYKFLPAFWTIASVMSFTVNIVMLIVLLLLFMNRGSVGNVATDQANQLLGGLYTNFVLMDQAHIRTNIHVEKQIPVKFDLNVSAPADVTLREDAVIDGALVTVATGGLNIVNARAKIVLPAGTPLKINIAGLIVPVDQQVLAVLDVPVDIPLNQTELHQPFAGLQKVVEPWYCLSQPNATVSGIRVCDTVANPLAPVFDLLTP
jgi:hypothetical protein